MPISKKEDHTSAVTRDQLRVARINQIAAGLVDGMTQKAIAGEMNVTIGIVAGILKRHGDAVVARMNQIKRDIAQAEAMEAEPLWTAEDEADAIASYEAEITKLPDPINTTIRPVDSREHVDTMLSQRGIDRILTMSSNRRSVQEIAGFLNLPALVVESVVLDAGMTAYWHDEAERAVAVLRGQHAPFVPLPGEVAFPEIVPTGPAPATPVLPVSLLATAAARVSGFVQKLRSYSASRMGLAS